MNLMKNGTVNRTDSCELTLGAAYTVSTMSMNIRGHTLGQQILLPTYRVRIVSTRLVLCLLLVYHILILWESKFLCLRYELFIDREREVNRSTPLDIFNENI